MPPSTRPRLAPASPVEPRPRGPDALAVRIVECPSAPLVDRLVEIETPLLVGREPGVGGLVVDDKKMSARHLTLAVERGGLTFRDAGSKNGTFHRGVKAPHGALAEGDTLRLGNTVLVATRRGPDGPADDPAHDLVGASPAFRAACLAAIAAAGETGALGLVGEPGVEMETFARLVHRRGRGADGRPFVAFDCAVAAPDKLASELFGASGALRRADGGTLFLDELGALDGTAQERLALVLERRSLDAKRPGTLDVRVVAALYPEVARAVTAGRFRADLQQRLTARILEVPPLSARREDILRLVRHHAGVVAGQPLFDVEATEQLLAYAWPENRRELRQLVMRIAAKRRPLRQSDLPKSVLPGDKPLAPPEPIVNSDGLKRTRPAR